MSSVKVASLIQRRRKHRRRSTTTSEIVKVAAKSSVTGFHEGEIDGQPYHLFIFSSQTEISTTSTASAIDSGGHADLPLQPRFRCPRMRVRAAIQALKENGSYVDGVDIPIHVSPDFIDDIYIGRYFRKICKLPVVPLFWCNNKEPNQDEFLCCACYTSEIGTDYYFCVTCDRKFHKECVEAPVLIKHPSYPFLSLQLYYVRFKQKRHECFFCREDASRMAYHCPTYHLFMHPRCAIKPIPIFIHHPKRHPHPLTFFPKQNSLLCDVCGVIKDLIPTYVCARCIFVVHQDCIYFPYVIRISRHHHRISFTYSLPSGKLICGVCRKKVDNDCGAYSCNKCDGYFVHSRCALRSDLWDGEELEGVSEEPEVIVEPFEKIADGIILHFSHDHRLKLEVIRVYDDDKFCQGCVLPIYEGTYYSCMDGCNFILHEICANATLRKYHPLYARPLSLKDKRSDWCCDACRRSSRGFVYICGPEEESFDLDLRCASVSEPFKYEGHQHPLFLALAPKDAESAICQICEISDQKYGRFSIKKLNCIECGYIICFRCATLPYKAMYKHDIHFLTFRKEKEASDESGWCEVCETKIVYSGKGGFYSCDDYCGTTLHVDCLLGRDTYMKPGELVYEGEHQCDILRNKTMTRPFCDHCHQRCQHRVVFKRKNLTFCSLECLDIFIRRWASLPAP